MAPSERGLFAGASRLNHGLRPQRRLRLYQLRGFFRRLLPGNLEVPRRPGISNARVGQWIGGLSGAERPRQAELGPSATLAVSNPGVPGISPAAAYG